MKEKILVILMLGLALGLRWFRWSHTFVFNHDQDLYSWIAKDILVNHHMRAVGQITSVDGVFIGGAYYYMIAAFYALSAGNPASAVVLVTAIGVLTVYSFYWIGKKLYGRRVGLGAAFVYATAAGAIFFDRWSVPTQPTVLWSIWFLYVVISLSRGWKKSWGLYGILVGLIWHVHIALLPIVPLPILAYFFSKNGKKWDRVTLKWIGAGIFLGLFLISPGILFELKTNFSQTRSMLVASKIAVVGIPTGIQKLEKVVDASGILIRKMLWLFDDFLPGKMMWLGVVILGGTSILIEKRRKEIGWIWAWVFLVLLVQFWSKRPVSEYYFVSIIPAVIMLLVLVVEKIKNNKLLIFLFCLYLGLNLMAYAKNLENNESLFYRLQTVDYIKQKALEKGYPCISINYIAKFGEGVGFRYLFWWKGVKVIKPDQRVANFDIVIPGSTSGGELNAQFGRFGIIDSKAENKQLDQKLCALEQMQLDPLLGYVD